MILCVCPNPSVDSLFYAGDFITGNVNRISRERRYPGGKGVHVALALVELGFPARLMGFWGGPTGEWIQNECKSRNLDSFGIQVDDWTRTCFTIISDKMVETEILGIGPKINKTMIRLFNQKFAQSIDKFSVVTMSGSWPQGAPDNSYIHLVRKARQKDIPSVIDCSGSLLKAVMEIKPFAIHINYNEAVNVFGKNTPVDLVKQLSKYCNFAALTKGAEGLYLSDGRKIIRASHHLDKIKSCVGSGDCLVAGLAGSITNHSELIDMAIMSASCGAANCLGNDLGMIRQKDVKELMKKTIIQEL
jgi:tagatose 6-phosphate kinase